MKFETISKTYTHVTTDEAKDQAQISKNFLDDDALIARMLRAATKAAENHIENHIALTAIEGKQEVFSGEFLGVEQGNFHSLQSIVYTDKATGSVVTLSGDTGYEITHTPTSFLIMFTDSLNAEDLVLNFKCGFDALTIEEKAEEIKQAILIKFSALYDVERSGYTTGNIKYQSTFENLLNYHKRLTFF